MKTQERIEDLLFEIYVCGVDMESTNITEYYNKIKHLFLYAPQEDVEVIFLEDGIDSMNYTQYDKDGDILKMGNIQYPEP